MEALFIGQSYIDVTFLADQLPTGDEKLVARDYAVSFGGNAVSAAFACAKLGVAPDLLCSIADDWLGHMFLDMAQRYKMTVHGWRTKESSLSFIMPKDGKRAIIRCRDDHYQHHFPLLDLDGCRALHVDGHLAPAALHYAKECRQRGILTSLDGGALRPGLLDLIGFIDVAVVSELLCTQMNLDPAGMLAYLRSRGCRVGAVTLGEHGIHWYANGSADQHTPALSVPKAEVIDTNGAGDIFHGAYLASWLTADEAHREDWRQHFTFARAASAHSVRHLGIEASLPSRMDVEEANAIWHEAAE